MIRLVVRIVDLAARFPKAVLAVSLLLIAVLAQHARGLEVRADLAELLPHDSPGLRALEHQMSRAGGSAMVLVIVSSPDRAANERYVDRLGECLEAFSRSPDAHDRIAYVESGTKDVRAFYENQKWLYADLAELERIDADLDHQIAIRSGMVEDLFSGDAPGPAPPPADAKPALGLNDALGKWDDHAHDKDSFPTGYFSARDGALLGIRVAANTALGANEGDLLLADIKRIAEEVKAETHFAGELGYTGDIASAVQEKKALVSEAVYATAIAVAIIVLAIVLYFRSFWSLVVIAIPVAFGVAAAYAFARVAFGHVNAAGAFLGAIIVGNGINYPLVLLARYREFRARGMAPDVARRESVVNALRAELVGACVAAIAYGSLSVTEFRGFRQFGAIGFVGMLLVWASIIPIVPALLVLVERLGGLRPRTRDREHEGKSRIASAFAWLALRRPRVVVALGLAVFVVAVVPVPRWIVDPWEYDFGKLGSRSSDVEGPGEWSNKANEVFGGKMNIAGAVMIADSVEQVPLVKAKILANDARDPQGTMISEIVTIDDALPGPRSMQESKLAVLERIRSRLTPRVLADLTPKERESADRARPPETLRVLVPEDLPPLVRRRFTERSGKVGTVFYVKPKNEIVFADGHNHLRLSATLDNVRLDDGAVVQTASRSTIFAEILRSMRRDGPLVSLTAFVAVAIVVIVFSRGARSAASVIGALIFGVALLFGVAASLGIRLNYVNFIAIPITLGIGCEYPFNIADRVRLLGGDVRDAVSRSAGAVLLCSFTTIVGYGSLMLSDFQALESFGKLAVAGEIACVLAAVLLLPSVLAMRVRAPSRWLCRRRSRCSGR